MEKDVTGFYISGHPLDDFHLEMTNFCDVAMGDLFNNPRDYFHKTLTIAGMITTVAERMSQSGNQYGSFVLEDFNESRKFFLFSEDYLKLKHFLVEGTNVLVQVRVQFRRGGQEQLEVKVMNISLLADALEKFTKSITVHLQSAMVTPDMISVLHKMLKKKKGSCMVKFRIDDPESKMVLHMQPRNNAVDPATFIRELKHIPELEFKIN